ncbi:MAG: GntR family transcriptional regulator [Eubacteriales bacterium]|nr:GntR family transcriptional regulator [Eubacteriales bacterium]
MNWQLDKNKPICPQICERVSLLIARGDYKPHDKVPSVRDLAVTLGVNPNTVQRAYESLEQQGMIYTMRGSGRFVSEDVSVSKESISSLRHEKTQEYFIQMKALGMSTEDTKTYVKEWEQ